MTQLLILKPLLIAAICAGVISGYVLLDVACLWFRLGRLRLAFPLRRLLAQRWAAEWPVVVLVAMCTWSLMVVVGCAHLLGSAVR